MKRGNFTEKLKKELIRNGFENACCKTAALSAYIRTTGCVLRQGDRIGFEFITESEFIAEFIISTLENLFGEEVKIVQATEDIRNGKNRLVFQSLSERSLFILQQIGIVEYSGNELSLNFGINRYLIENDCCKRAYIAGAFLGSGSCILPNADDTRSGYHLEIVFSSETVSVSFCELLSEYEILAKSIERKGTNVVYLKSRESISDFLALIGAEACLRELDELAAFKDERNQINRIANCMQKNFDKSILASVRHIQAIEKIQQSVGLETLNPTLRETALARLTDKEASLKELSDRLHISKSCLNHRLRKLEEIAKSLSI